MSKTREYFYIPNLIGYARISLLLLAVFLTIPFYQALCLTFSRLLDTIDGEVARRLKQTSRFGARLDLLGDMADQLILSYLAAIALSSYWTQKWVVACGINDLFQYSLLLVLFYGAKTQTSVNHKKEMAEQSYLLRAYYSKAGLFLSNVLNDAFLLFTTAHLLEGTWVLHICFMGYVFRHLCVADQNLRMLRLYRKFSLS